MRWVHHGRLLLLVRVFVAAITTAFVVVLIVDIVAHPDPLTGNGHGGRWGTATVTRCESNHECYGDFTSDTGTIDRHGVRIWYADGAAVGQRVRAYADTGNQDVSHPGGEAVFISIRGLIFVALIWLTALAWLIIPLRRRRHLTRRSDLP